MAIASPPSRTMPSTLSCARARPCWYTPARRAPSTAKRRAIAWPIPLDAPVTIATLPSRRRSVIRSPPSSRRVGRHCLDAPPNALLVSRLFPLPEHNVVNRAVGRDSVSGTAGPSSPRSEQMRTPREVSESYWAAECRRDLDAVMEHYGADATYEDAGGLRRGEAEIRRAYEESAAAYPGLEVRIVRE